MVLAVGAHPCSSADIDAPKTKSHRHSRWLFQFGVCRETTMLLRSTLILGAVLVAGSASTSIAAGAKHSEHEKSYT
jgi:hypothetical protein